MMRCVRCQALFFSTTFTSLASPSISILFFILFFLLLSSLSHHHDNHWNDFSFSSFCSHHFDSLFSFSTSFSISMPAQQSPRSIIMQMTTTPLILFLFMLSWLRSCTPKPLPPPSDRLTTGVITIISSLFHHPEDDRLSVACLRIRQDLCSSLSSRHKRCTVRCDHYDIHQLSSSPSTGLTHHSSSPYFLILSKGSAFLFVWNLLSG